MFTLTLDIRCWRQNRYVSVLQDRLDPHPGIEQISWILKGDDQRDILRRHYLIQPEDQIFPEREIGRHSVDLAAAKQEGFYLPYVLRELRQILQLFQARLIVFEWEYTNRLLTEAPNAENVWDAEEATSVFCVQAYADKLPSFPPYRGTLEGMSRRLFQRELLGRDGMYCADALWDCYQFVHKRCETILSPLNTS